MIKKYLQTKVIQPLLALLKEGMSPKKLAASIALGLAIGLFPILGTTTALLTILVFVFRLNLVAAQIIHYALYPVQLILIIPLIQLGERIFGQDAFPYTLEQLLEMFENHFWTTLETLGMVLLRASVAWGIIAIPLSIVLYFILLPVLERFQKNFNSKTNND